MTIVEAVKRAIEEDAQECWSTYTRFECPHDLHLMRYSPDGFDAEINRRLARGWPSTRARMTHVTRNDGSLKPWLLLSALDLSAPLLPAINGRRVGDKAAA